MARGRGAGEKGVAERVSGGGEAEEAWLQGTLWTRDESGGDITAIGGGESEASSGPRLVGGACKGGVAGGEGRFCRESGGGDDGQFMACDWGVACAEDWAWSERAAGRGGVAGGEGGSAAFSGSSGTWTEAA